MTRPETPDDLVGATRRKQERLHRQKADQEDSVASHLAWIGALGWTVAMPTILGAFLGRWLDQLLGLKMPFTAALLVIGLILGCVMAWRKIQS